MKTFPGVLGLLIVFATLSARADERTESRFRLDAARSWERLSELDVAYAANIEHSKEDLQSGATETYTREVRVNGRWALFIDRFAPDSGAEGGDLAAEAYGTNSKYAFKVKQYRGSSAWIAEDVQLHTAADGKLKGTVESGARWPTKLGTLLYQRHIDKLYRSPGFALKEAKELRRGRNNYVEVHFTYRPNDDSDMTVTRGVVILDPERYWSVVEAALEIDWPSKERGTASVSVNYDESEPLDVRGTDNGRIAPVKKHIAHAHATKPEVSPSEPSADVRVTSTFATRALDSQDESPFTLSAFGLPEPPAQTELRSLWWLILAAGILLLGLGLLLRRGRDDKDTKEA